MTTKETIKAKINGIDIEVSEGTTILEAARTVQVNIPTLCKHQDLPPTASCGICVVKLENSPKMVRACSTPIKPGMSVITHDPEIIKTRKTVLELTLSNHPNDCLKCGRNGTCELQKLSADFGIRKERFDKHLNQLPEDSSTKNIELVPDKCILCGRCIEVCQQVQDIWALSFLQRGIYTRISPAGDIELRESPCIRCGQCSAHCPTGAIFEYDQTAEAWDALMSPNKHCVVQIAPAVRVTIGEAFGMEPGTNLTGKLYTLLRRIGFKAVFDTNFAADVTIIEEASEFKNLLLDSPEDLPLITTCCPSWVDYMEKFYPDMIDHFSSCKSPHQILGVLSKTYYAERLKMNPEDIFVVSIMPCTSKKYEISRDAQMSASGYQDVDLVLTTRELSRMIAQAGIDFAALEDSEPDHLLGDYSGAGVIFGSTGGVMEAAVRTAYNLITGENLTDPNIEAIRGLDGVKETSLEIADKEIRIVAAHGMGNIKTVLERVKKAKKEGKEPPYHFIEVMACPGGCIGGGGQPYGVSDEIRRKRAAGLYSDDASRAIRFSHDNPAVKELYEKFLGEPLGKKAQELLHTTYEALPLYRK
ncbi:MAG: 4Fe-4S binding protein [Elusimicrobia bacterium]|nr:4Fe-4S binding protein [Elusimicrobiota bacterium]